MKNVKKNKNVKNNKGFSLVELIVVIAIMAVLVGVLAPQFMKYVEKSREATDIQNLDSMVTQVETYCADNQCTSVTITMTQDADTVVLVGTEDKTDNVIGTSKSTRLKSQRISKIVAVFDYVSNSWEYTITSPDSNAFYEADGATEITTANN